MSKIKNDIYAQKIVNLYDNLILTLNDSGSIATFNCHVEEISPRQMLVSFPEKISGALELTAGDTVMVSVDKKESTYEFQAKIDSIDMPNQGAIAIVPLTKAEKSQRRKFVRIDIQGKVTFRIINLSATEIELSDELSSGALLNISAGGILVCTTAKASAGDYMLMNFRLKHHQKLENIIGITKRVEKQQKDFLVGVEFLTKEQLRREPHCHIAQFLPPFASYFDDELERHIVQYVYSEEIDIRKRKKIREE